MCRIDVLRKIHLGMRTRFITVVRQFRTAYYRCLSKGIHQVPYLQNSHTSDYTAGDLKKNPF